MVTEFRKTFRAIATRNITLLGDRWLVKFRKTFRAIATRNFSNSSAENTCSKFRKTFRAIATRNGVDGDGRTITADVPQDLSRYSD